MLWKFGDRKGAQVDPETGERLNVSKGLDTPEPPFYTKVVLPITEYVEGKWLMYRADRKKWVFTSMTREWIGHPEYAFTHYIPRTFKLSISCGGLRLSDDELKKIDWKDLKLC